jgi:hypothetical protein
VRTAQYQLKINEKRLFDIIAQLQTSINNFKNEKGHDANIRVNHLSNDALNLVLALESYSLLKMMEKMDMILLDEHGNMTKIEEL